VVIHSIPTPSVINNSAVWMEGLKRAEDKSAAAVVLILGISGNFTAEMWAKADKIPTFSVGMDDGMAIRDLIESGSAKLANLRIVVGRVVDDRVKSPLG
jgi:hypothetical protein